VDHGSTRWGAQRVEEEMTDPTKREIARRNTVVFVNLNLLFPRRCCRRDCRR
jgi:hypothetical protein